MIKATNRVAALPWRREVCDFDLCRKCWDEREWQGAPKKLEMRPLPKSMCVDDSMIPSHWDKARLEDIPMGKGLSPKHEGMMNKFAKIPLPAEDVREIQCLGMPLHALAQKERSC